MLVAIVSQNSFVLVFMGVSHIYRAILCKMQGVYRNKCVCVRLGGGGIAPFWGSANPSKLKEVSRDMGYRSDSIAISRDMGPLRVLGFP